MGDPGPVDPALDHLHAVEIGADRVFQSRDNEAGAPLSSLKRAAHRYAFAITAAHPVAVEVSRRKVPSAEHPHRHPRPGGGVNFLAQHRVEDLGSGIAARPDPGIAAGEVVPAEPALRGAEILRGHGAFGVGLVAAVLAEKVVLVASAQRGVRVGRTDHPELVGIDPGLRLDRQPALQCLANILAREHRRGLALGHRQIAQLPPRDAVSGELVVGRKERMRLAVALDLGDLDQRLARGAAAGIGGGHRPAAGLGHLEHQPVGQVRIMRDRQHPPAGVFLIGVHVVPQRIGRGCGPPRAQGHHGLHPRLAITEDHVAVEVLAPVHQGELEPEHRGEIARLVIAFDGFDMIVPDRPGALGRSRIVGHRGGQRVARAGVDHLGSGAQRLLRPGVEHIVPALHHRVADQDARRFGQRLSPAQRIRMIGDHQEIERAGKFGLEAHRRGDFLAAREPQRLFGAEADTEPERIDRVGGMQMSVTPIYSLGVVGEFDPDIAFGRFTAAKRSAASRQRQCRSHRQHQFPDVPHLPSPARRKSAAIRLSAPAPS